MLKLEFHSEIERPVEEVFAYWLDLARVPEWNPAALECRVEPPGPVQLGSRIETVGRILGRRFESTHEVTELVPNRRFGYRADSPFPIETTFLAEPMAGGTRVTVVSVAEPAGFFRMAEPVLGRIARKQLQANIDTMKELIEAREPASIGN
jgi:uncharacterized membrane protein